MRLSAGRSYIFLFPLLLVVSILAACGNSGSTSGGGGNPPPPPPQTEFLYAGNITDEINTLTVDTTTGALTQTATATGSNGVGIAATPAGTFVYASDFALEAVDGYATSANGTLSAIAGSPFAVPGTATLTAIAIDPAGKFLYAAGNTAPGGPGIVAVFSINSSTGELTPVAGSPFAAGIAPLQLAVGPSGEFLYVSDLDGGVLPFSISSGVLTPIAGPFSGGQGLAISSNGQYLYSIGITDEVWAFTIDSGTGGLTPVAGSPFFDSVGTGGFTGSIAIDPSGTFLYVYNTIGAAETTISGFSIDSGTGALSPVSGSPFNAGPTTFYTASMSIDPTGKFLYASCSDGGCGILAFSKDATTGVLTPLAGSPFNDAFYVSSMTFTTTQ